MIFRTREDIPLGPPRIMANDDKVVEELPLASCQNREQLHMERRYRLRHVNADIEDDKAFEVYRSRAESNRRDLQVFKRVHLHDNNQNRGRPLMFFDIEIPGQAAQRVIFRVVCSIYNCCYESN